MWYPSHGLEEESCIWPSWRTATRALPGYHSSPSLGHWRICCTGMWRSSATVLGLRSWLNVLDPRPAASCYWRNSWATTNYRRCLLWTYQHTTRCLPKWPTSSSMTCLPPSTPTTVLRCWGPASRWRPTACRLRRSWMHSTRCVCPFHPSQSPKILFVCCGWSVHWCVIENIPPSSIIRSIPAGDEEPRAANPGHCGWIQDRQQAGVGGEDGRWTHRGLHHRGRHSGIGFLFMKNGRSNFTSERTPYVQSRLPHPHVCFVES